MTGVAAALPPSPPPARWPSAPVAPAADHPAPRTAIVIDAPAARDGRALVDPRLRAIEADVRLPRNAAEARTDVRYFAAQGYDRVVVAGPRSTAAAGERRRRRPRRRTCRARWRPLRR